MPSKPELSRSRAELIARSHACVRCKEYSYRKVAVRRASEAHVSELGVRWEATLICGVCGLEQLLGIDDEGDIAYVA